MLIKLLKYTLILALQLLLATVSISQDAIIKGSVPGGENVELKVLVYQDYISYRPQFLNSTVIDDSGNFSIQLNVIGVKQVFLEIEHYSLGLFIEPEGSYVLECDTIDVLDEYRPKYNQESLPCILVSEPDPGLNILISDFNQEYNDFILREFGGIYQRRNTNILKEFKTQAIHDMARYDHPFLKNYVTYKIAVVELAMAPAKKADLYGQLIKNKDVLINHPEYMDFFHEFFDHQMFPDNKFISRWELSDLINYQVNYPALIDSLGKDSTLRNEVIRELVCMNMLGELYRSNEFSKSNVIDLLEYIQQNSKFRDHPLIAKNLIKELTLLNKGYKPPPMELTNLKGQMLDLSDLEGRPVYINFFTTWSYGCLAELELMNSLVEEYKNHIQFVSVSFDRNIDIVEELVMDKKYEWTFLHAGAGNNIINTYRIKTFPLFLLLDKNGNVVDYPAYKPSEIIRDKFDKLLGRKQ